MDDRVFVINDMATIIEMIHGAEMVTFHGTPEWALDYVYLGEAVWLPEEGQLRQLLEDRLASEGVTVYDLLFADEGLPAGSHGVARRWPSPQGTRLRLMQRPCCT